MAEYALIELIRARDEMQARGFRSDGSSGDLVSRSVNMAALGVIETAIADGIEHARRYGTDIGGDWFAAFHSDALRIALAVNQACLNSNPEEQK